MLFVVKVAFVNHILSKKYYFCPVGAKEGK